MDTEVLIIGGGIVGLACAAECARRGYSTILIERHQSFGQETSSRNSEVIHSGIYYTPGSIKARLCPASNAYLYEYCERNNVWYNKCGKLIVAVTNEEEPELEKLFQRGKENGVPGVRYCSPAEVQQMEPNIFCTSALYLPTTGIVDTHELMRSYLHEAKAGGAEIVFGVEFRSLAEWNNGFTTVLRDSTGEEMRLISRYVINSGGLGAGSIAEAFGVDIDQAGYRYHPNRGHYFRVSGTRGRLVSRLVYPVPLANHLALGIHITIDKAGQVKLGPDQEYCYEMPERDWYRFDESRKTDFFHAVKRYFPPLEIEDLSPDQIGIRPKIQKPGESAKDFIICEESSKGLPGLVNLIGIESPGLTCARQIAIEAVERMIVGSVSSS